MQFVEWSHKDTVREIANRINEALSKHVTVLWLTSGGSNVRLQTDIMDLLRSEIGDRLTDLTILPVDERFGLSGHADSNHRSMKEAGFDPGAARWLDVLEENTDFDTTIKMYNQSVSRELESNYVVATLGLGADGHTAGILPSSPAIDSKDLVCGYQANYQRMTLTPLALREISVAFVIVSDESKKPVVDKLRSAKETAENMPAMALYDLVDCTVVNTKGGDE